ncbi:hypothetical protein V5799_025554 [Amblyomma americanum]|uniref:Tick transposon n=1 Tax=Amblyomma americanum TaxID=6943 RepID=A0AAQ4E972_AMBAM
MADEEDALHMLDEDGIRNALHRHRRLNSFGCSRSLRKLITEANATLQRQGEAARLVTAIQRTPPPGDAPAIASTSSVNAASGQEASKGGCAETFVTPPPPRLRRFDSITPVTISRSEAAHGPALLSTKPSTADAACQHDDTQTCLDSQNPAIPEADSNVLPAPAATTNPAPAEAFTEADYERAALAYAEKRASAPPARRLPTPPPAEPDRATAKGLGAAVQKPARNAPRRRIQTTAAAPLAPAAQPSAARFTAAPPQQGKKSGIATVLYYPVDRMANYLKPTRDAIAAQLSKLPGVKAVRVNFRRNVVAVDAHASADLDPLLGITTICDIKVRAKEAGGNSCTGRVFRVDRALSTEDIMSGIECKVPVLACTRSGNDIILRFAGTHPPEEVSLFKLRRPVRARLPRPLQCLQCGVIGHATAVCTAKPRCLRCGRDHHKSRCDSPRPRCINCNGTHTSTEPRCPRWQQERKVAVLLASSHQPMSRRDARRAVTAKQTSAAFSSQTAPADSTKKGPPAPTQQDLTLADALPNRPAAKTGSNTGIEAHCEPATEVTAPPIGSVTARNCAPALPHTARSFRDVVVGRKPDSAPIAQLDQRDAVIAALAAAVRALIEELPSASPARQLCAAALAAQQALNHPG